MTLKSRIWSFLRDPIAKLCPTRILLSLLETQDHDRELYPTGHFYSAVPSQSDLRRDESRIWPSSAPELIGIDLRTAEQMDFLGTLSQYYEQLPWTEQKTESMRYYYENNFYSYSDAILLFCMIRHLRPNRIIELGSGFSSAAILDVNEMFLDSTARLTCVEPYSERLHSLIRSSDKLEVIEQRAQDVPLDVFLELEENDILFVDSTHVLKAGSDVVHLLSEILPRLKRGVYVHFHDIFYPFEYPKEWVFGRHAWNESYALRAFLTFNSAYEIVLFNTYMESIEEAWFARNMPLCLRNRGGSLWIRKTL